MDAQERYKITWPIGGEKDVLIAFSSSFCECEKQTAGRGGGRGGGATVVLVVIRTLMQVAISFLR